MSFERRAQRPGVQHSEVLASRRAGDPHPRLSQGLPASLPLVLQSRRPIEAARAHSNLRSLHRDRRLQSLPLDLSRAIARHWRRGWRPRRPKPLRRLRRLRLRLPFACLGGLRVLGDRRRRDAHRRRRRCVLCALGWRAHAERGRASRAGCVRSRAARSGAGPRDRHRHRNLRTLQLEDAQRVRSLGRPDLLRHQVPRSREAPARNRRLEREDLG